MSLDQIKFMTACGQTVNKVNFKQIELYQELIREEVVKELFPALQNWTENPLNKEALTEVLDGIGDVLVVVEGLALSFGLDPEELKRRIDLSNLTKIPEKNSKVTKRDDGKILKPASFKLPELDDLVEAIFSNMTTALG